MAKMTSPTWETKKHKPIMDIKTKFDIYDTVYFLEDNRVKESTVEGIGVGVSLQGEFREISTYIYYKLTGREKEMAQSVLHKTKKDLAQSLTDEIYDYHQWTETR